MQRNAPEKPKDVVNVTIPINVNLVGGVATGLVASVIFHPLDRALFIRARTPFAQRETIFAPKFWSHPFSGLRSTFYQRLLSQGGYFTAQGELNTHLKPFLRNKLEFSELSAKFTIGLAIGVLTGVFSNANNAVKHYAYRHPGETPLGTAIKMLNKGGIKPFMNGIRPGILRDMTFGSIYESLNVLSDQVILQKIPHEHSSFNDAAYVFSRFTSAIIATVASSPFNHARAIQFDTPLHKTKKSTTAILVSCWLESEREIKKSAKESTHQHGFERYSYFAKRFNWGPGTLRSGVGIVFAQLFFNKVTTLLRSRDEAASDAPSHVSSITGKQ